MTPLTTVIGAFVAAVIVATLMWGGAGLAIALPIAFIAGAIVFVLVLRAGRDRDRSDKVEFTERDKQTLASD